MGDPVTAMSDSKIWSIHLTPLADEQLSSWLVRLAQANGFRVGRFCRAVWGWDSEFCQNRDFDRGTNHDIIDTLAAKTGVARARVWTATLLSYEGFLVERFNVRSPTMNLILPVGLHPSAVNRGFQFCPQCLASDCIPYYRRRWRIACMPLCTKHASVLLDRCPKCGKAPNFGRITQGRKWADEEMPQHYCAGCGYDLRKAQVANAEPEVMKYMLRKQTLMESGLDAGVITVPQIGILYSHHFFSGLRILLKTLTSSRIGHRLEWLLAQRFPVFGSCQTVGNQGDFELQSLNLRFKLTYWTWQLLEDWPTRFINLSLGTALFGSEMTYGIKDVPYWLWSVIRGHISIQHSTYPRNFPRRQRFPMKDGDGKWVNWTHRDQTKLVTGGGGD